MDSMKITSNFSSPSNTEGLSKEPCEKEIKAECNFFSRNSLFIECKR